MSEYVEESLKVYNDFILYCERGELRKARKIYYENFIPIICLCKAFKKSSENGHVDISNWLREL